ncbi:unnamed protein product [Porites lobata]|uniref:SP-RING-type domain-containing protein n=1 Tax=Porites lobata TaxID=104759 RepID=A0ABN8NJS3_9CNID|nr:unnamed protein product [Porites lobata]
MPKDRERSHEDKDREKRSYSRSSSSRHRRPKHSSGRRESSREHRRHRPYQREKDSLSSTHIYFTGSDITPSVSVHTDHVTLASNLSSLVNTQDGMLEIFENCCQMLERLRQDQATNSALWRSSSSSSSDGSRHRGANNFSQIMELRKVTDLVPAAQTKQQLHQKLLSHSEAKLESIDISLFCPLTHSRIVTPVRGKKCRHVHCFDGEAFCNLMWEKDVAKWKCPICKGPTPLAELIVDGLILDILASVPEDVKSVEFTSDGFWRLKQGASLPSANTSSISLNYKQGNNEVIDLTFDTPEKVIIKKNTLVSNTTPPVIDLTLSP